MKIIIDIPDKLYEEYMEDGVIYNTDSFRLFEAIANGTPLPKGHGKIIDVKSIVYEKECVWESDGCCTTVSTPDIDATPAIIEADKR